MKIHWFSAIYSHHAGLQQESRSRLFFDNIMCENAQSVLDVSDNEGGYILKRIFYCFNFAFDKHLVNQAISADVCVYADW